MYLINYQGQLLGYTYEAMAIAALMKVMQEREFTGISYEKVDDNLPMLGDVCKSRGHIENLVRFYAREGYSCYYWKYIQYNRNLIPKFSQDFIERFQHVYEDMYVLELNRLLDTCLNRK